MTEINVSIPIMLPNLGRDNIKQKTIVDFESDERGAKLYAEYFGCEMDISAGNRASKILAAFMPYNKNPKTPYTSVALGLRQIRAFLVFFPRCLLILLMQLCRIDTPMRVHYVPRLPNCRAKYEVGVTSQHSPSVGRHDYDTHLTKLNKDEQDNDIKQ